MHKQMEILRKCNSEIWHYAESLETLLDECCQYHHSDVNFRAARPPDPDVLLGQGNDSQADAMMGGDDNDQDSDDGNDPTAMAISIPLQSLQVR